ncbi:MAG: c-type cytochrome [Polyangiaceae bacterium]
MKRSVIVGCGILGLLAANCSAPAYPDATDDTSTGGTGGRGGTGGVFGTGGSGPKGGSGGTGGIIGTGGFGTGGGSFDGGINPKGGGIYSEPLVEAEDSPPPLTGGTLTVIGQGHRAAVSDPDHDQVVTVDLDDMAVVAVTPLQRGDEPNRSAEDPNGRVHVVLRGGHGVAVIEPATGTLIARLPVCRLPRGIAYDPTYDAVHVACAGGELVSYSAKTGELLRKLRLERDLRDIVVDGNRLLVSRFRAAELLVVESNGTVSGKLRPPSGPNRSVDAGGATIPAVAWRTVPSPDGGALMVYQSLLTGLVPTTPGGYGGRCGGIISTSVSLLRVDRPSVTVDDVPALLPIDLATTSSRHASVASAAWTPIRVNPSLFPFTTVIPPLPSTTEVRVSVGPCGSNPIPPPTSFDGGPFSDAGTGGVVSPGTPLGRVVALAYATNRLVLQTREPATIMMAGRTIELPGRSRKHSGHELFHLGTLGGIACASCHPEGGEDGQVWTFAGLGPRRTQNVSGGISGTEPFHWSGDMDTFTKLAHDVFQSRMTGPQMGEEYVGSLFRWVDKIPALEAPVAEDLAAVERGKAIFNSGEVGCATCHAGERFTNNASVNVQTGGAFQVPSLRGIAWRAPYMHQGCAPTLDARFDSCGGGDAHGKTSQLTAQDRADLVAYLETL